MKYKILQFLAILILYAAGLIGQAQDLITPRKALVIRSAPGFSEAITLNDPVELSMVQGKWARPAEGSVIRYDDTAKGVWETASADSQGWIQHESLNGGYAYVNVESKGRRVYILEAMGHSLVYVNGVPRAGNPYQMKETWEAWEPRFDYSLIPIQLEDGKNDLLFSCSRYRLKIKLYSPRSSVLFNTVDQTMPDLITGERFDTWGAVVVINATGKEAKNLYIKADYPGSSTEKLPIPPLLPLSIRKVGFHLKGSAPPEAGKFTVRLSLFKEQGGGLTQMDTSSVVLRVLAPSGNHKETFISSIDGSVQYYSVNPSSEKDPSKPQALFLSLHGASVEAVNQSASYYPKNWGHIVSPTNRRPYGFNWEDWGRLDAMEVLEIAKKKLNIDENRVYLTGHSMGGHGVYHLGALFPDHFAAIGPSAGWISFWTYRVRHQFQDPSQVRQMLMRATLPSETYTLSRNYSQLGVYILHGSKDDNVPPEQAHLMSENLSKFQKDFVYDEREGMGHWWDNSDEPGADCVDWPPMFDYFARHCRPLPERVRQVDFVTASPGISSENNWVSVQSQKEQMKPSSVSIRFDPGMRRFSGTTNNVERLALDVRRILTSGELAVELDSQKLTAIKMPAEGAKIWLEKQGGKWLQSPAPSRGLKWPGRYGTLKDAFRNRMMFLYGTKGSAAENKWALEKARFDAERFWYQGNGSVDILADAEFKAGAEPDRNVIVYGNSRTNSAWKALLGESPVQVGGDEVKVGGKKFAGSDICCLFIRPRPGSDMASVGVISGTGITGMKLTNRIPYLMPGVGFPDCVVFDSRMLKGMDMGVDAAGFFGNDWSVESGDFVWGGKSK